MTDDVIVVGLVGEISDQLNEVGEAERVVRSDRLMSDDND